MIPMILIFAMWTAVSESELAVVCSENNDLYRVMKGNEIKIRRFENPETALKSIKEKSAMMILADKYPDETNSISDAFLNEAQKKGIRLYLEYPSHIPNIDVGDPRHTHWERAVVSSDIFEPSLPKLRILGINDCYFVPVKSEKSFIVVAKVAGLDSADYGLPQETFPILFEHPDRKILVSTTKLSQFITARYSPNDDWKYVWNVILRWLQPDFQTTDLKWNPLVYPSYSKDETLPDDFEHKAFERGVEWFTNSHLLVHESWKDEIEKRQKGFLDGVAPLPESEPPIGDGSYGILEGYSSSIKFDGTQPVRYYLRNDCNGEVSMAMAFGDVIMKNSSYGKIASNINDYIRFNSNICLGPRNDPESPSYGLHGWDTRPEVGGSGNYYGDDNARAILGTIATSALLKTDRWNDSIVRNMIANLRTTGVLGFRQASIIDTDLQKNGWQYYMNQHIIHYAPHYQAYLWAVFIWAYHKTGYEPFLNHAKNAIEMTMIAYPDRWQWTNGIQQERARMLLPLAWLIRVEDTPKHREWIRKIAQDMIRSQDSCGAIGEELGDLSRGSYPPPRSNEAYGTNEASLISKNGDPISDLLYTTNFAFIGLHEASVSTGEDLFINAENKLADFLCRIQVDSKTHPELDGGWFRAFDFNRWDYWGSNADAGWGAWSIESGWTQGWIASVLAMRQMKTSFWDVTENIDIKQSFKKYRETMLPQDPPVLASKTISHDAIGKKIQLLNIPDPRYPGNCVNGLIDGEMAFADHTDFRWHGFEGDNLNTVIDLGEPILIKSIGANFLQSIRVGIFLPKRVEFSVSEDGQNFQSVANIIQSSEDQDTTPSIHLIIEKGLNVKSRYIKVHAENTGVVPDWHSAKGLKAWMFIDEIIVNPSEK
jgi:hypothetical protein